MFKEIFHNIIDFLSHLWNEVHTSINDDFEQGGIIQAARNRYSIALVVMLVVSMSIPLLFRHSPVKVEIEKAASIVEIPNQVIKQAIFMNAMQKMGAPGEYRIGELKVVNVIKKQVEGVDASIVSYEMEIAPKKGDKQAMSGTVAVARQGEKWTVFLDAIRQWAPVS